jgi:hypothetical protein
MPKVTIEYNFPEEKDEFDQTNNAAKYYAVLWDIDQYMRNKVKYASDGTPSLYREAIQMVRDEFWRLMHEYNLDLNK